MTNFVCAVADCQSVCRHKKTHNPKVKAVQGWARFPHVRKEATRRRVWEARCRRPLGWKATRNHAICSLHFIDWGENGPSLTHPDPVLFAYNKWGKNCFGHITRKRNILQCLTSQTTGSDELQGPTSSCQATQTSHNNGQPVQPVEMDMDLDIKDWPVVEMVTSAPQQPAPTTGVSSVSVMDEYMEVQQGHDSLVETQTVGQGSSALTAASLLRAILQDHDYSALTTYSPPSTGASQGAGPLQAGPLAKVSARGLWNCR
ncbi:hypothetical protein GWK47_051928 [Chionoecetes opilio]|uniref:THAP-type domain-containing protein n=1 Tax=Chionoecetes opilio TaxID=41210 RepID=A0A8J4Y7L6_CHIOP|nr:hypothetical protein GWK47_051928 [Chionoecetes opilio]